MKQFLRFWILEQCNLGSMKSAAMQPIEFVGEFEDKKSQILNGFFVFVCHVDQIVLEDYCLK